MNYNNKNSKNLTTISKLVIVATTLVLLIISCGLWGRYLNNHFLGSFDEYGIPSHVFQTGWDIMLHAWPMWIIPAFCLLIIVLILEFLIRDYFKSKQEEITEIEEKKTTKITAIKEKKQTDFTHALEIEELKQQVDILKHKYFEEHKKTQEDSRSLEEMSIALEAAQKAVAALPKVAKEETKTSAPPNNAHYEAVISSLKADNRKLQKQIAELQEDLEQSNALIEKLLESQGS